MGHDLTKSIKIYKAIYIALMILTVITVAASYIPAGVGLGIIIALVIATLKASLVAGYFMHLKEEQPLILWVFGFTLFFCLSMIILIYAGQHDLYEGAHYVTTEGGKHVTAEVSHNFHH